MAIQGIHLRSPELLDLKAYFKLSNFNILEDSEGVVLCEYYFNVYPSEEVRAEDIDSYLRDMAIHVNETMPKSEVLLLNNAQMYMRGYALLKTTLDTILEEPAEEGRLQALVAEFPNSLEYIGV